MRREVALLALVTACGAKPTCAVAPHAHGAPFLWRVQKGNGPVLWLYGTIHDAGLDAVPPAALDAFDHAAVFASELGDDQPDVDALRELTRLPRGPSLDQLLGNDDWWELRDALLGVIKEDDLKRVRPWYAMSLLSSHATPTRGPSMDDQLAQRAEDARRPIEHLETWREQMMALTSVVGVDDLKEAIHARKTMRCELAQMRAIYEAGDLDGMTPLLIVPRIAPQLVYARNDRWLPALEHMAGDRGGFVAVGLAHLIGDHGLPALLAHDDFTVARVP
ncbi:MAG: TraB/GumN family protein [Deltaproteobacteria bacterium]|nr:TraB/GumN family protein [Deltaproteobacteria bacterium]